MTGRSASHHLRLPRGGCCGDPHTSQHRTGQLGYRAAAAHLDVKGLLAAPPADTAVLHAMVCDPHTRELAQRIADAWQVSV